jgi:hypothetical protein
MVHIQQQIRTTTRLLTVYHSGAATMFLADGSFGKDILAAAGVAAGGGVLVSACEASAAGVEVIGGQKTRSKHK